MCFFNTDKSISNITMKIKYSLLTSRGELGCADQYHFPNGGNVITILEKIKGLLGFKNQWQKLDEHN